MTELVVYDKQVCEKGSEKQNSSTSEKLAESSRQNSDVKCSGDHLAQFNVERQVSKDDGSSLTRYPNGVKTDRGGVATGMEPPPGGSIGTDKDGNTILMDANKKTVARLDKDDKEIHVYTKHGEYVEAKDGKITYKPADGITNLQTLHKEGTVEKSKYEDYGMTSNGTVTRFPNGCEFDSKTNKIIIPADHQNFHENVKKNDDGSIAKRTGYDSNGKELYTWDKDGLHVPTADGTLHKTRDGKVTFESNTPAAKTLPKVVIDGADTKQPAKKKPMDPLGPECAESRDPLCGLDLEGKF